MLITNGAIYTFGVFFEPLQEEFGWTRAVTSGAFSMYMILHGALYIVTGRLNDRFGPRVVMTVCGLFLGAGYIMMSQTSAVWHLYLFYGLLISIGISGTFVPLLSTVARWFEQRRGLMTGIVVAGVAVGTMVMPPLAAWLIVSYGWRLSYLIIGGLVLASVVVAARFLRRDPTQMGLVPYSKKKADNKWEAKLPPVSDFSLSRAFRTRQFWLLGTAFAGLGYCQMSIMVHVVIYARGLGLSPGSAATIMTIIGGVGILSRIIVGSIADRIGTKIPVVFDLGLLSFGLILLAVAGQTWAVYVFAAIFGLAYGGLVALMSPAVAELFGLRAHGGIMGAITFCLTIGGAMGPIVTGYVFDVTGSYQLAFFAGAAVAAAAGVSASLLRPVRVRAC